MDKPFILLEPDRYIITGVNHMDTTIPPDGVVLSIHRPALSQLTWLDQVYLGMEMQLEATCRRAGKLPVLAGRRAAAAQGRAGGARSGKRALRQLLRQAQRAHRRRAHEGRRQHHHRGRQGRQERRGDLGGAGRALPRPAGTAATRWASTAAGRARCSSATRSSTPRPAAASASVANILAVVPFEKFI